MSHVAGPSDVTRHVRKYFARRTAFALCVTPLLAVVGAGGTTLAVAQQIADEPQSAASPPPAAESVSEVVVSGSRIQRDGYNAPTPVSVINQDILQTNATSNIADLLNTMPNFVGSATPQSSAVTVTSGTQAVNGLNIGGLGANRTLVLVNGQRTVSSTLTGIVDVSELPQQLITRVDVVTGGASAGYGSDALTGIVNFVLDTKFNGIKAEVQGGRTNFGDDNNYTVDITAGTPFANGKGHFEISGELVNDAGLLIANRPWNDLGIGYITNPNYKPGSGMPQNLLVSQIGVDTASYGGTIASGPFRGTMFGPGGVQTQEVFGSLVSDPLMSGGSWASQTVGNVLGAAIQPEQDRKNIFTRASYDVAEGTEVYLQASYAELHSFSDSVPVFFPGTLTINSNNAFLPQNIASGLAAAGVTSFKFGTFNGDLGIQHPITDREVTRFLLGSDGKFNLLGTDWTWDAYASYGVSLQHVISDNTINVPNYMQAINAVQAPNGSIQCANPSGGCVPLDLFGLGVASQAAINYVIGNPYNHASLTQAVESFNFHGSPFNDWAGPVSFAFGAEHRKESTNSFADPQEADTGTWFLAAGLPYSGSFSVTEGYLETDVPLLKDMFLARALDINAAIRETGYSTFGLTHTWKVGGTWSPVDDLRFRATRSLDIREPTLVDLYQAGTTTANQITDPFNNNASLQYRQTTTGNPNLVPEKANNTVIGVVYQPSWLPRFSTSFDYYITDISSGIETFGAQQLIDLCYNGSQTACNTFTREPDGTADFIISPLNFATEHAERFELESSYRLPLSDFNLKGDLGFHGSVTHYITDVLNSGAIGAIPSYNAGVNAGDMPNWKYQTSVYYQIQHYRVNVVARGVSAGVYNLSNIQCTIGCPDTTPNHVTVSDNHIAGAIYFDLGLNYSFDVRKATAEVFFNVRNLLDKDPPIVAMGPGATGYDFFPANDSLYDVLGRVYQLGFRVQL